MSISSRSCLDNHCSEELMVAAVSAGNGHACTWLLMLAGAAPNLERSLGHASHGRDGNRIRAQCSAGCVDSDSPADVELSIAQHRHGASDRRQAGRFDGMELRIAERRVELRGMDGGAG